MIDNIILLGSSGMLGNYIYSYFKRSKYAISIISSYRVSQESLQDIEEHLVQKGINANSCVINCIGCIPQRQASGNKTDRDYFIVNSIFPHVLWQICKKYDAKLIHPTTDCVFNGVRGNYIETDIHDETNNYGISKSVGEPTGCTVIRCSIIGKEQYNKKSLLEFVIQNANGTIQGYDSHMWNGITCLEYCKVIEKIITNNMFWKGVRHILSPTPVSKYELCKMISQEFSLNISITKHTTPIVDKTLKTIYPESEMLAIQPLTQQVKDLFLYEI
jgi:dTDP-4-dehydrorhamnose reductase